MTPVPVEIVDTGVVVVAEMTATSSVSLTRIEATGSAVVPAIAVGETVTPVPVVTVTAGTFDVQAITPGLTVTPVDVVTVTAGVVVVAAIVAGLTVTPVPVLIVGAGTVEVQAIVVALTVTAPVAPGLTVNEMPTAPSLTAKLHCELPTGPVPEPVLVWVSHAPELSTPAFPDSR